MSKNQERVAQLCYANTHTDIATEISCGITVLAVRGSWLRYAGCCEWDERYTSLKSAAVPEYSPDSLSRDWNQEEFWLSLTTGRCLIPLRFSFLLCTTNYLAVVSCRIGTQSTHSLCVKGFSKGLCVFQRKQDQGEGHMWERRLIRTHS